MVELISDNEFEWGGRYDSIINSGGVKLIPEKIEEKLSTLIKVRFFVAGIPDESLGEKLVLIIEGNVISNDPDQEAGEERNLKTQIVNLKSKIQFTVLLAKTAKQPLRGDCA